MGLLSKLFGPKPPPPAPIAHPVLGELIWQEEGWWEGQVEHGGSEVKVSVGGDATGPYPDVERALMTTLARLKETNEEAIAFLLADYPKDVPPVRASEFTLTDVCHLSERPKDFRLSFKLEGDEYAIWRVEFENGQPKYTGRDD